MQSKAALAVVICAAALLGGFVFYRSIHTPMGTKTSPGGRHTARLLRSSAIDVNFYLFIDGDEVYRSADFAPVDADFREQLYWDAGGDSVILEIADTKLFGYNATEGRKLSAAELDDFRVTPFAELRFEGDIPDLNDG